jgi:ATP-dependent DNA ligase
MRRRGPGWHDDEVQLYAFDVLALESEDLRKLPLTMRKANLARLLARRPEGIASPSITKELDRFRSAASAIKR